MGPTVTDVLQRADSRARRLGILLAIGVVVTGCVSVVAAPAESVAEALAESVDGPGATPTIAAAVAGMYPRLRTDADALTDDDPEVYGFLPYWLLDDALPALDLDRLTTLAWFGVEANGVGELVKAKPSGAVPPGWAGFQSPAFVALQARAQAAGVRVVITVQRFGWTEGGARRTQALLESPEARTRLAQDLARLVEERRLDGVNLDVEPMTAELADEYVALVREVRAGLDAIRPGLEITVDVTTSLAGYDLATLTAADAADAAIIMGYNYRGAGSPTAGSQAPLDSPTGPDLSESVEGALAQVETERLILALPWYGRTWSTETAEAGSRTLSGEGQPPSENVGYAIAAQQAEQHGRNYQPDQTSAWTAFAERSCETCPEAWRQTWYDDPDSFGAKVDYALATDLRGVGIWALGYEAGRPELWSALGLALDSVEDTTAPVGEAGIDPTSFVGAQDGAPLLGRTATLRLSAQDEPGGSGMGYVRISAASEIRGDRSLALGRTYPNTGKIMFPLDDPSLGGSADPGPRAIHVQWRDLAGNWSEPVSVGVWASLRHAALAAGIHALDRPA